MEHSLSSGRLGRGIECHDDRPGRGWRRSRRKGRCIGGVEGGSGSDEQPTTDPFDPRFPPRTQPGGLGLKSTADGEGEGLRHHHTALVESMDAVAEFFCMDGARRAGIGRGRGVEQARHDSSGVCRYKGA